MTYEEAWENLMICIGEIKEDIGEHEDSFNVMILCVNHIESQIEKYSSPMV